VEVAVGKDFKLELVLIDDPVAMRDAYAAGNLHVGWATLDMLPLFSKGCARTRRVMPRVYQQVDWSNGGDGIVVRERSRRSPTCAARPIVLAQNSPSQYFVLNALINAACSLPKWTSSSRRTRSRRRAAFNADKRWPAS
jgi:hypothetical protein